MGTMFGYRSERACRLLSVAGRLASTCALTLALLLAGSACEDMAVGRPCDITVDASAAQGAYNSNATDCPSHLCVKPAVQPGVSVDLDTGPYCTIRCTSDDDCNGQTRDPSNQLDNRCRKGFTCAPVFPTGPVCCEKICLCRDFVSASVGPVVPDVCKDGAGASCS